MHEQVLLLAALVRERDAEAEHHHVGDPIQRHRRKEVRAELERAEDQVLQEPEPTAERVMQHVLHVPRWQENTPRGEKRQLPMLGAINATEGSNWPKPPADWLNAIAERKTKNVAKMGESLAKNPSPMNFHSALNVVRDIVKANPDAILVNEGANALDFTRSIVDMYKPRKRIDVGTWGIMGVGMGYCVAAAVVTKQQVIAIEGDSAFGFSGMEVETLCRYNLPVCAVIFNNNGVYRGTDVNPTGGSDVAPTVFVKGARYDKLIEAFGGVGVNATTPAELRKGMEEAIRSKKPTLINAVIDETAGTESGRITNLNPSAAKKK